MAFRLSAAALRAAALLVALTLGVLPGGCSVRRLAVDTLGDALSQGGSTYARDDDPELVRDALPFALKTIEGLLEESPSHPGLLLGAASGFTQYSRAFLVSEADYLEERDPEGAAALRLRGKRLYLRGRDYGMRGLEAALPGFGAGLRADEGGTLGRARPEHVPLLYWTAAAWASAISVAVDDAELTADLPLTAALMARALELDEGFGLGAIHDFFVAYDGGRPAASGGSADRARQHLASALRLSEGRRAAPLVTFAETVCVGAQDRAEFGRLLQEALTVDVDQTPDQRLANRIAQKRARWLLGQADRLFIE